MKTFSVYVIKSVEGFRYTGMTEDLQNRLQEHNNKSKSFWTKRGNQWRLIFFKNFASKSEALKYEKWLKSGVGREYLKKNCQEY
jgi:putative endonuclease